jgi:hypothetical protein
MRVVLLALVLAAGPAAAEDRLDAVAAAVDRAVTPAGESAAVERMARFLATTPQALRAEQAGSRLGWGDVFLAHRIATRGGHPLDKVMAARRTGAPWGDIVKDARVESDLLVQDVAALWPDAARATPGSGDAARPGPPAGAGSAQSATSPAGTAPTAEEPKGFGARVRDFLRGSPDPKTEEPVPDRTQEEIRDRMIRGGGGRTR